MNIIVPSVRIIGGERIATSAVAAYMVIAHWHVLAISLPVAMYQWTDRGGTYTQVAIE